jgi:hypothetical protein
MKHKTLLGSYELVWVLFPRRLSRLVNGYMQDNGYSNGVLVKVTDNGRVFWHKPSEYLEWVKWI